MSKGSRDGERPTVDDRTGASSLLVATPDLDRNRRPLITRWKADTSIIPDRSPRYRPRRSDASANARDRSAVVAERLEDVVRPGRDQEESVDGNVGAQGHPTLGSRLAVRFNPARWRGAVSLLFRHTAKIVMPLLPDAILALGTYRLHDVHPQIWEDEYRSGNWSYMSELPELGRYSIIVGYCDYFKPRGGSILDVGCGEGILQQKLAQRGYRRYLGVDLSATALAKAGLHADERTEFQLGNI